VTGFANFNSPTENRPAQGREVGRYVGLDLRETEEGRVRGVAPVREYLRGRNGQMRPGPLLTLLDSVGGLNAGLAALPDGWVVSTNLAARFVSDDHGDALVLESEVLRKGRNSVVAAVRASNEGTGAVVADGILTSSVLIPEGGPPVWTRPVVLAALDIPAEGYPVVEAWLATRSVDAESVEMPLHEHMRNPRGILHGGVVSMLIEQAVEHATGAAPVDVAMHFLAPNRVGPVRASARLIGARADAQVLRVEVRDIGADRLTALAVATTRR
jgi:uncharacterized protein (TIGR00369 family)